MIILYITLLFSNSSYGQSLEASRDVRFDVVSTAQGLSQSCVYNLAQDKQGFIWVGTRDGLNRFDGYDFISFKNNPQDTNSLSNNEITKIFVNSHGNLWIGTRGGGLNHYNQTKNRFTRYANLNYENIVRDIFESEDGTLWVGSSEGLLKAEKGNENERRVFTNVSNGAVYTNNKHVIPRVKLNKSVISISSLSKNILFIGTEQGAYLYDKTKNLFDKVNLGASDNTIVTSSLIEKNGTIWVGTFNGLVKLYPEKTVENAYSPEFFNIWQKGTHHLLSDRIEAIRYDCFGNVWVGSHGGGLIRFAKDDKITTYVNDPLDGQSLGDNIVNSLLMDNTGVLWIGTESQGCNKLDLYRKKFIHIHNIPNNSNSLSVNSITAMASSGNDVVWVGSAVKGLDKLTYHPDGTYKVEHFKDIPINTQFAVSEVISLLEDRNGALWIGTGSNTFTRYRKDDGFKSFPMNGYVFSIHCDRQNGLWLGTWGQGLAKFDRETGAVRRFTNIPGSANSLSSDKVLSIFDDAKGNLWVGTKAGGISISSLADLEHGKNNFKSFKHKETDVKSIVHNDVYCIMQDSKGNIWLGTGGGLCKVVWPDSGNSAQNNNFDAIHFESYLEKDGLPNNVIYGILEDSQGNLWLSTNNGLSMFNPGKRQFKNYGINDGLQANEFRSNAFAKDNKGNMFFGGVNGLTVFNPDNIKDNPCLANAVITRFKVFSAAVKPGMIVNGQAILENDIAQTKHIELTYKVKEITFEFSALHYANPQRIKYAYRLLGFNDKWQTVEGSARTVTYTNLGDGKYTFQVKATNNDGKWNETPVELTIKMLPPLWRKPWFYFIYVVIILLLLYGFQKYSLIAVKEKNRLAIERLEHKKQLELSQAKMRFFTNVSHEIRTPLTLISDPLNQVIRNGNIDEGSKKSLNLMANNVSRLLHMVNQLLQLQNIDLGSVKLKVATVEFAPFIKGIADHFVQSALRKNITFSVNNELGDKSLCIDKEKLGTVFYNLLSNAFKFTPEHGTISVNIYSYRKNTKFSFKNLDSWLLEKKQTSNWVAVEIADNGTGIPQKELKNIFHRFYQVNDSDAEHHAGSGIGLALVKDYVGLHRGQVKVTSKPGHGSIFTVYLRTGNHHLRHKHYVVDDETDKAIEATLSTHVQDVKTSVSEPALAVNIAQNVTLPSLLIIEDDIDLAGYMASYLAKYYTVELVHDGKSGLQRVQSQLPDLVISDVMLPEMNGLQLCQHLKTDIETSHIPVILLTARVSDENIREGYDCGADVYVAKPFNIDILAKQVHALLESRATWRKKFSQQLVLMPTDVTISSTDEQFLKKLVDVTDVHLSDSEFDVTRLVDAMNMSHAVILRKVKALTDMSLVDFIKNQRLKKAALILQKGKISIADVGYMVGFSDPKYFSKCFIKEFGKTPTGYCQEYQSK